LASALWTSSQNRGCSFFSDFSALFFIHSSRKNIGGGKKMNEKYYCVIAKCGHVGKKNYIPIAFAVKSTSLKEAAKLVRRFPRVKHHDKNAIISCKEITLESFNELLEINKRDPYLHCSNRQEQKMISGFEERVIYDRNTDEIDYEIKESARNYKIRKYYDRWDSFGANKQSLFIYE